MKRALMLVAVLSASLSGAAADVVKLQYAPSPADNPLKGLVPYVTSDAVDRFPHSVEFHYYPLSELMTGPESFDWSPIEETLALTQERGVQLTFRVFLEFPGRKNAIPQFLIDGGLKVTKWENNLTPDYEDPQLRAALKRFIAAFGEKYDGDPRVAWITAGLLGAWGEWHTYPRDDLWASFEVQDEVLDAYEAAFEKTPILLRYPAKDSHYAQAANHKRPFGYHDDSFGFATLETGREEDSWFFIPLLKEANAMEKWKTQPIGGELRPELWRTSFTDQPHVNAQDFRKCVEETHATWLMDSGLFEKRFPLTKDRRVRALEEVRRMGYEFHVSEVSLDQQLLKLKVENRGVAPFYADWAVELAGFRDDKPAWSLKPETWKLTGILPDEAAIWETQLTKDQLESAELRVRIRNPMEGGFPLRFANRERVGEWLILPEWK